MSAAATPGAGEAELLARHDVALRLRQFRPNMFGNIDRIFEPSAGRPAPGVEEQPEYMERKAGARLFD